MIDISNSPHPSSLIRNGGALNAGGLSDELVAPRQQGEVTLLGPLSERLVQVVSDFAEDGSRNLLVVFVQKEDLYVPLSEREAFDPGWLVATAGQPDAKEFPEERIPT